MQQNTKKTHCLFSMEKFSILCIAVRIVYARNTKKNLYLFYKPQMLAPSRNNVKHTLFTSFIKFYKNSVNCFRIITYTVSSRQMELKTIPIGAPGLCEILKED